MSHHHHRHSGFYHYYRRAPSRFLWFALGAGTVVFFIKHRQMCSEHNNNNRFGFCVRAPVNPPPNFRNPQQVDDGSEASHSHSRSHRDNYGDLRWEKDKGRLMEIGQQAGAAVTEVSEATLDSVLETMTSLKAKIAKNRAEREKMQAENSSRRVV